MNLDFLQTSSFQELERKAFEQAQRIFPCEKEFIDAIPMNKIISEMQKNCELSNRPFLIRTVGQSGSGKSTQLVPALQNTLQDNMYIRISVGMFAVFHPNYEFIKKNNPNKLREKTNGFALRALILFYKHCILKRINILFDMTLLEPEIDIYLMTLAKHMGYQIQMHLLCVPKRISDYFIRLRQQETGRYVLVSSSSYFFRALAPCLKSLTQSGLFNNQDSLILWTHNLSFPIKTTHLNNPHVLNILQKYQGKNLKIKNPNNLLKVKKKLMKLFVERLDV